MSVYTAHLEWKNDFAAEYTRSHVVRFASGQTIKASSAPEYKGDASLVNPEEALAGALSSCHMLTFLALAAKKKLVVTEYRDTAEATLAKNTDGKMAITQIRLKPQINFQGTVPGAEEMKQLHDKAHEHCFIANTIRADVVIDG